MLDEVISHPEWPGSWTYARGSVIQRAFAHDIWHCAEVNETLVRLGSPPIDLWD